MSIKLVDGHKGSAADGITSSDVGKFREAMFGSAARILDGCDLTASGTNYATVSIGPGQIQAHGRHVRISSAETLTLTATQAGYARIILIGLSYACSNSVESVSLASIAGERVSSGTPVAPSYTDNDWNDGASSSFVPLWGLTYNNINGIKEPVVVEINHSGGIEAYLMEKMMPVGFLFMTKSAILPEDQLGFGTWTRVYGKFVRLADGNSLSTGGSDFKTIPIESMPAHSHGGVTGSGGGFYVNNYAEVSRGGGFYGGTDSAGGVFGSHSHSIPSQGGGQPLDIRPAYEEFFGYYRSA